MQSHIELLLFHKWWVKFDNEIINVFFKYAGKQIVKSDNIPTAKHLAMME